MKKFGFLSVAVLVLCCCGCFVFPLKNKVVRSDEAVIKTKVVDSQRLKTGGSLVMIPFRAGSGIAQTLELERIALMFVKGFTEAIEEKKGPLRVIAPKEINSADFILKGHVVKLTQTKSAAKWFSKPRDSEIALEGEMIEQKTGRTVFTFSDRRKVMQENPNHRNLAFQIGRDMASVLVESLDE